MRMLAGALALTLASPAAGETDADRYQHWCARCHGEAGDGRGLAARALALNQRPPRDFRTGLFKWKSTPTGAPPTDEDLRRTIRDGLPGTSMPYFADLLTPREIDGLIGVVRSFSTTPMAVPPAIALGELPADTAEARAAGARLYGELGCAACHGADGSGAATHLTNADGSRALPTDLTRPWRFRGGSRPADVAMRLAAGIDGTPMPSYLGAASGEDLWKVTYHVRTLARAPGLRDAALQAARDDAGAGEAPIVRGEYLAKSGTCFLCHVQMGLDGSYVEGSFGQGGMKVEIRYVGTQYSRNLTPDVETGLGAWSREDFRRVFREGRSRNGRVLNPLDMPWTILHGLTDADVDALFAYLQSLPPVRNAIPDPEGPGFAAGLFEKAAALITGSHEDAYFAFHPRNYGSAERTSVSDPHNPRAFVWLGLSCIVAWLLLGRRRSRRGRMLAAAPLLVVFAVYVWPPVTLLPTAMLLAEAPYELPARMFALPPINPPPEPVERASESADPDVLRLARRGRYVATIGTCSLCHTAGPAGSGSACPTLRSAAA
jgi:mono/diheme cytochrome c family protein